MLTGANVEVFVPNSDLSGSVSDGAANLRGVLPTVEVLAGTDPIVTSSVDGYIKEEAMEPPHGDYQLYSGHRIVSITTNGEKDNAGEPINHAFRVRPNDRLILRRVDDPHLFTGNNSQADVPDVVVHQASRPLPEEHGLGWRVDGIIRSDRLIIWGEQGREGTAQTIADIAILNTVAEDEEERTRLAEQIPEEGQSLADWANDHPTMGVYLDHLDDNRGTGIMADAETLVHERVAEKTSAARWEKPVVLHVDPPKKADSIFFDRHEGPMHAFLEEVGLDPQTASDDEIAAAMSSLGVRSVFEAVGGKAKSQPASTRKYTTDIF